MKAIHIIAIIFISFMAGMFGGAFSERVFANPKADEKIPEQIIAHGFYLADKDNKPRAGMSFDAGGNPVVYVRDKSGTMRGYLVGFQSGPMLALTDEKGNESITMGAYNDGASAIGIMAANNKPRIAISYAPGQRGGFALFDDENVGKALMVVDHGSPSITLMHGDKKPAISLLADRQKGAMLAAWNSQGRHRLSLGLMHDKPLLFAYNPDDTGLLFNTQRDGRPALGLLSDGRVVWSATGAAPQMPAMDGILDQILR